jgi:Bacterial surface protein, Ig-like domain/Bacterial Ig-like domain/GEVED domain
MSIRPLQLALTLAMVSVAFCASAESVSPKDDSTVTLNDLVDKLKGDGVTIDTPAFSAEDNAQAGIFSGYNFLFGAAVDEGVVFSTGDVVDVVGANSADNTTTAFNNTLNNDPLFGDVRDLVTLSFNVTPTENTLIVEYVFGSEEYNEYVNSGYNDFIRIFVDGNNCAVTANGLIVSIDAVNNSSNSFLYKDNDFGDFNPRPYSTEMDGFTKTVSCRYPVTPGVSVPVVIGMADDGDAQYDSWAFFKAHSLRSEPSDEFGDAPDTYQTLAASNGAAHTIIEGVYMGTVPSGDQDGFADGIDDSLGNAADDSSDDGVLTFPNLDADTDTTYSIIVNATSINGKGARIMGWIDLDRDGQFQTDEASNLGTLPADSYETDLTLTWPVIGGAGPDIAMGRTYARIRMVNDDEIISSGDYAGILLSGEVEDYQFQITGIADVTPPVVQIDALSTAVSNNEADYPVTGICTAGDNNVSVSVAGATPVNQSVICNGGGTWAASFDVSGLSDGIDVIVVDASQQDANSNLSNAAQVTADKDVLAPTVDIQNEPAVANTGSPFSITIQFSEDVTGFALVDIAVNRGTASNFVMVDADTYTADITPDGSGNIVIDIPANVAQDIFINNNTAAPQATVTLNNTVDATRPVITLLGSTPVDIELGTTYVDAGATAVDNIDGDITASIVTVNPVDINTVGTYTVTYNVTDAAGNLASEVPRTVNVTPDATIPVITLTGSSTVNVELGYTYIDSGATALDNIDGDLTGSIVVVNPVNVNLVGSYTITYDVADAAGNSAIQVTRTVNVTPDATMPAITLLGSTPVDIELGTAYVDAGATAMDNISGDITASIVTVNPVNVNAVGSYTVTYNVADGAGNNAVQVTRTVNVTPDATIPVITLSGSSTVDIELGNTYIDAGATALDNIDGVITGSIVTVNPVDINTVGSYTITYNVADAAGNNAAQVTRTVNVTPDVTAPVINLSGSTPVNLELGTPYSDAGATASDNIDGDITASIVTVNPVDINTVGSYTITYNVTDVAGNTATEVSRTVNVTPDVTVPVITLAGSNPVDIELGTAYVDAGATALDNIDGDITASIVTVNPVDINTVGSYTVTYDVMDAAGNAAVQVSRTVNITPDVTVPVITLTGSDPVDIELGTPYADEGATASDNIDGDITVSIVTVNPVDINTVGSYTVTYNVSDAAGNVAAQVSRTVNITPDVTIPVITLNGSSTVNIELGNTYTDTGATAVDNIDGDISGSIVTVSPVDTNTVGTYTVTYNVSDAAGNAAAQVTRTVNVTPDVTIPVVTLSGGTPVNLELGTPYVDAGATAVDNIDGDITASIITVNPVDVNTVGAYTVTYDVVDAAGNAAVQVSRTVNITPDVTVPVITLTGSDPVDIELGSAYVDAGATAADNIDGDISAGIVTVNPVDTNTVGSYTITYDVSDTAGNAAAQVTRTVNVTPDVTVPVITLTGSSSVSLELGTSYSDAGATAADNIDGDITASIMTVNPVNVNTVGSYTVTYNVTDAAGNAAVQVSRMVTITPDVTIPVINLSGSSPVSLELGTSYSDAGATAADNIDGDITASIVTVNPVDINTVGSYTVTYNVSDAAGNAAAQVTRTVNVTPDVTVPVITLSGSATVSVELGSTYSDAGATATDNIDGDITASIVTVNTVDINTVGSYTITYNVTDAAGNTAVQVTRTVNVTPDVTIPVITLSGSDPVNLELGTPYVDAGATAVDNIDGSITASIVTINPVDVNAVGTYTVTYNVADAAGNNAAQVTRTVSVTPDVTVPVITLSGSASVDLELGTSYSDAGATALDNIDGDITGSIVMVNPVDINIVGSYTVTYDVMDAAGNAAVQVSRTVNITPDVTIPVITLNGSSTVNIELGNTYTDAGATAVDNIDGDISASIVIVNPVDINTVGSYTVTYNVSDAAGNAAVQATRTVNVTPDVTIPVITLAGSDPVDIELGTAYADAGATASDNIDGDITASIATVNPVDINTVGSYTVTYNVVDTAGNAATQVSRTVNVTADVTIPVITLTGSDPVSIEQGTTYADAGATASDNIDGDITASIVTVNPVDINAVGSYTVTYNVMDAAGNAAIQVTRTVNITPDVTIPAITLLGSASVSIEQGGVYSDAGATASDNIDGDITASIVAVNPVDMNTIGTYTVTYNVSDAAGNAALQVSRTVNVTPDVTAPVINMLGANPESVELGSSYADAGATALDNVDGDISLSIAAVSTVNTNAVGSYTVTYNVSDTAGNAAAPVVRTVNVTPDATLPVITLSGSSSITIERGAGYLDIGATASDNIDGDITGSIVTVNPVDPDTAGTYTVTYDVSDAAGNAAVQVTRTVNVSDSIAPGVSILSQPASVNSMDPFTVTFQFTEVVSGFISTDISVLNATVSNFINVGGTGQTYSADITPDGMGDVTISVNAGVAQDVSANANTAAVPQVTTFDNTPPDVEITSAPDVNIANQSAVIISGTCVVGDSDVAVYLTIGALPMFANASCVPGDTWSSSFDLSTVTDGVDHIDIGAQQTDAAGNVGNATFVKISKDTVRPDVQIQNVPGFVNDTEFIITVAFDEDVNGFDSSDIAVTNGVINVASFNAVDAGTYTVGIAADGNGDITLNVLFGVAQDLVGNGNNAAAPQIAVYDITAPVVSIINAATVNAANAASYNVDGSCDTGDGDVTVAITGATPETQDVSCTTGNWNAVFDVTAIDDGVNVISIDASQTDAASNTGTAIPLLVDKDVLISVPTVTAFTTNIATPVISGTADVDTSNEVAVAGATYTVIATVGNIWSIDTATATPDSGVFNLVDGANEVVVTSTDGAGNAAVDISNNEVTLSLDDDNDGIPNAIECPAGPPYDSSCPDADGDGIPDFQEVDSDNDGIPDASEVGLDSSNPIDSDGDGTPDYRDTDSDNDSIDDAVEGVIDSDGDGIPDYVDVGTTGDSDGDGIPDLVECPAYPNCPDSDSDGSPDYLETDSDNDGIDDSVEAGVDPANPVDSDGDGLADYRDTDSDNEGADDSVEGITDVDADGIPDYVDADTAGPGAGDSDGDGIADNIECEMYPLCADSDADGTPDYMETDSDNDGIPDAIETGTASNDVDNDGIDDALDVDVTGGLDLNADGIDDSLPLDTDGDGLPDYRDTDSDGDGLTDATEGVIDTDADGIPDYLDADDNNAAATVDGSGDSDGDGISDKDECLAGLPCPDVDQDGTPDYMDDNPYDGPAADFDNDGLLNYIDPDDDNDRIPDVVEDPDFDADNNPFTNPLDTDSDGIPDYLDVDSDADGLSDADESGATGNDHDNDNIDDRFDIDVTAGTDANADGIDDAPVLLDADNDNLPDYLDTVFDGFPEDADTDKDGIPDAVECPVYPTDCPDSDADGMPDFLETDADNDGIDDSIEAGVAAPGILSDTDGDGTPDYRDMDSDNDGIDDSVEGLIVDADSDGIPDALDADSGGAAFGGDSDGDGVADMDECLSYPGCTDSDNDGTPDYMDADVNPYDPDATITTGLNGVGSNGPWSLLLIIAAFVLRRKVARKY